ncbi:MAG TPA: protein-glutamate O-methyltransferase CheR [Longimicrobiales bacterium]|nr:protein-glutamate O-methyltransferase CheR [Longimicrobiales bacterium]
MSIGTGQKPERAGATPQAGGGRTAPQAAGGKAAPPAGGNAAGQAGGGNAAGQVAGRTASQVQLPDTPSLYPAGLERIEVELLLEALHRHYGYDFRSYAYASLKRRLWKYAEAEGVTTISGLQDRVLHDPSAMERLLMSLSVNVTAMFRDPGFYRAFREKVVPLLRTYPFVRIWHAGCATGEEVYSMAILLQEEGLYDRTRIYATDINEVLLQKAREGIFPLDKMQEYTRNYQRAGGTHSFSGYYTAAYDGALFSPALRRNVVFAQHNLVTDRSFSEFNVILCRNVMIYFDRELQSRVHRLFYESLPVYGILALGSKESLRFSAVEDHYEELSEREKIYRKVS